MFELIMLATATVFQAGIVYLDSGPNHEELHIKSSCTAFAEVRKTSQPQTILCSPGGCVKADDAKILGSYLLGLCDDGVVRWVEKKETKR